MAGEGSVPGIGDRERLSRWLASALGRPREAGGTGGTGEAGRPGEAAELRDIQLIVGGRSNLTYRMEFGGRRLVLRRPPLGHVLPTAHDMSREYRILTALRGTDVPVPGPVAFCDDLEVIGTPFYVMEHVPGVVLRTRDDTARLSGPQARELSLRLAGMLAAIHAVDLAGTGLTGLGRGAGYLRRQLERWQRQWELSATRELPAYDQLVARLKAALPDDGGVTLVHGDFRLDNTLVTIAREPRIEAVVDWEMATLGDPLADLGLTLTYWTDPGERGWLSAADATDRPGLWEPTATAGFLTRAEFAARYAELTGRDLSQITYYMAFGCFKLAVVLEGINARYLQRKTVGEGFEREGAAVPFLIARAHEVLDSGSLGVPR
ncbi:MAG: phosphotransferase family protein [Streptosporangiaceae bacterium]|nr:phosphotransferase family protein [Streptosporangiaceae bacterium]MBV9858436.1 phosphotransferase family protein [Streptosporangiaceae bacterium]